MSYERKLDGEIWLIFSRVGRYSKLSVRTTAKKPKLAAGEIPMRLKLSVPDRLFDTPQFSATLDIPDTVPQESRLTIPDDIARLVHEQMGIRLTIVAPPTDGEENT